jgi:hypothetical protein
MATFLFTYRVPRRPLSETLAELDEAGRTARMAAWNAWFDTMAESVIERGNPVNDARTVGTAGTGDAETRIGGYSVVRAADMDAAVALAQGCPAIQWGGGVEVGEFIELPAAPRPAAR